LLRAFLLELCVDFARSFDEVPEKLVCSRIVVEVFELLKVEVPFVEVALGVCLTEIKEFSDLVFRHRNGMVEEDRVELTHVNSTREIVIDLGEDVMNFFILLHFFVGLQVSGVRSPFVPPSKPHY
jgi:hypothetical protein